jgi:hypothetical protein
MQAGRPLQPRLFSLGLSMTSQRSLFARLLVTSQQYFSLRTNQPLATSQQYSSLRTNQHQPSATSQPNRLGIFLSRQTSQ